MSSENPGYELVHKTCDDSGLGNENNCCLHKYTYVCVLHRTSMMIHFQFPSMVVFCCFLFGVLLSVHHKSYSSSSVDVLT